MIKERKKGMSCFKMKESDEIMGFTYSKSGMTLSKVTGHYRKKDDVVQELIENLPRSIQGRVIFHIINMTKEQDIMFKKNVYGKN